MFSRNGLLKSLGIALLVLWGVVWVASLKKNHLVGAPWFFGPWSHLGEDFQRVHRALTYWRTGGNPYTLVVEPVYTHEKFNHPPAVLWCFSWTLFFSARAASAIWIGVIAVIISWGSWLAWRARGHLGLSRIPLPAFLAAILWSGPVMFMTERGNWDGLVVVGIILALAAMRRETAAGDIIAGLCLALAAWIKIAPGILLLGVLVLRRWRLAGCFVGFLLAIALADVQGVKDFLVTGREMVRLHAPRLSMFGIEHSIVASWPPFWASTPLHGLAALSGKMAGSALVIPWVAWVSYRMWSLSAMSQLVYAYFTWLVAAACFLLPVSYDYKLIFLLLTAAMVWSRRDPIILQICMVFLLLIWQPFDLSLPPRLALVFKLAGFVAVGLSLARRAREQNVPTQGRPPDLVPQPVS